MADNQDILSMSDEDFAKMNPPSALAVEDKSATPPPVQDNTPESKEDPKPEPEKPAEPEVKEDPKPEEQPEPEAKPEEPAPPEPKPEDPPAEKPVPEPEPKSEPEPESKPEPDKKPEPEAPVNAEYETFYKKVMAPFKANGKTIQLTSVDEVVQLMQMGANYTKKMQSIQQHKKYLMMLENNGLLDESKLSFLIDLDKKNPEAVKKLLKDAKIDPVDIDPSEGVNYQGGTHVVTDQEAAFNSAIDELSSSPEGKATIQSIHTTWDAASKKELFDHPEILGIIHSQHENGIYAKIVAEMDRRKVLGQIAPNASFLQTYKMVGDSIFAKPAAPPSKPAAGTPVAVRPAKTPVAKADQAARARAAASPRSAAQPARTGVNVLAMSDDDFLKQFGNKY